MGKRVRERIIVILDHDMFQPQIDPEFIDELEDLNDTLSCIYTLFILL